MPLIPEVLAGTGVLQLRTPLKGVDDYHALVHRTTTIGRHPDNALTLPRDSISRFHAKIEHGDKGYRLEDLNSRNGCFVNGERIEEAQLQNQDMVRLGDVEFVFYHDEATTSRTIDPVNTPVRLGEVDDPADSAVLHSQEVVDPHTALDEIANLESIPQALKHLKAYCLILELIRQQPAEDRLLDSVLGLLLDATKADRGVVLLGRDGLDHFRPVAMRFRKDSGDDSQVVISRTIASRCVRDGVAILSADTQSDERFSASDSVAREAVRSAICVPLLIRHRVLGVCYLDVRTGGTFLDRSDLAFVANLTLQLALAIDNLRMTHERSRAERLSIIGRTMTEISHSIKNMLMVTQAGAGMMDKYLAEENLELLGTTWRVVKQGIERMNLMARDMLSYSRLEDRERETVRADETAREVFGAVRAELERDAVDFTIAIAGDIDPCRLDRQGLHEAIMNLVVNARDAVEETTGGAISIAVAPAEEEPGVVVTVSDNGMGIAPEEAEVMFHPFYTTKGKHGTGMGLAMVKRYADEMGGEIRVHSEPGRGATFELFLPRGEIEAHEAG